MKKNIFDSNKLIYFFLCILFVLTIQIFDHYRGNAAHLIHSIKFFDTNKLENDWIANQVHHLPLFVQFNHFLIKFFSVKIIYFVHSLLLGLCVLFLFLVSKNLFPRLGSRNLSIIWFALFIILFHENSFFSGVAGQSIIDVGYQPASFGILIFVGIYFYLSDRIFLSVLFICLGASFHPTYVLHSGFLISGILIYYLTSKNYSLFLKTLFSYIILILPITIFIIINFMFVDENLTTIGQNILFDRIKHHADIHQWLSYKDGIFLLTYFISLYLTKHNRRFFIFFFIFGFCSIFLSTLQYFIENTSLALAFPWRSSVFLAPISSVIILSYLIQKLRLNVDKIKLISYMLITLSTFIFGYKSHFIENSKRNFSEKLKLTESIKKNFSKIDRILIPPKLDYVRMYSGLPIFIDWKHHAFRFDQVIEWKKRMDLANDFYASKKIEDQGIKLEEIQKIEYISHVLIKRDKLKIECNDLINHKVFVLVDVNDCYNINLK